MTRCPIKRSNPMMMISDLTLTRPRLWTCPCGATWEQEFTISADPQSRQDLLARAIANDLQCAVCPRCDAYLGIVAPLLLITSGDPPLILSIPEGFPNDQRQELAIQMIGHV